MKNSKNIIWIILTSSFALITIPMLLFWFKFKNSYLSDNIIHWGEFGSYLSGISSLVSLLVLSILTYYIADNSNKANRNLKVRDKRLEIYDITCQKLVETHGDLIRLLSLSELDKQFTKNASKSLDPLIFIDTINRLQSVFTFIEYLEIRYNHTFNELFKSKEYEELKEENELLEEMLSKFKEYAIYKTPMNGIHKNTDYNDTFEKFVKKMESYI